MPRKLALLLALFLVALVNICEASEAFRNDEIGYFEDADQLFAPEETVSRANPNTSAWKKAFCERTYESVILPHILVARFARAGSVPAFIAKPAADSSLALNNPPGFARTGMCWFWSRIQRASMFLLRPAPHLPKPSPDERRRIIQKLIDMNEVIELPGYKTVSEFFEHDRKTENALVQEVDYWAVRTFFRMFVRVGDSGSRKSHSERYARYNYLHSRLQFRKEPVFLRFNPHPERAPLGIVSHSYLLLDVEPYYEGENRNRAASDRKIAGYRMIISDPNSAKITSSRKSGPALLMCPLTPPKGKISDLSDEDLSCEHIARSYDDFDHDLVSIRAAVTDYCRH
jgi:hypothetical protein